MALLSNGDCQKLVEPFSLDLSTLDELTEQPVRHEASYLVGMARVEALDMIGESRKAVKLLERHL